MMHCKSLSSWYIDRQYAAVQAMIKFYHWHLEYFTLLGSRSLFGRVNLNFFKAFISSLSTSLSYVIM